MKRHELQIRVGYGYFGGFNVSGGISQKIGDWDIGGNIGVGKNYWGWNASVTYDGFGVGYGQTHYGGKHAPYVQDPGNWLNYNRYAYCMNNPRGWRWSVTSVLSGYFVGKNILR